MDSLGHLYDAFELTLRWALGAFASTRNHCCHSYYERTSLEMISKSQFSTVFSKLSMRAFTTLRKQTFKMHDSIWIVINPMQLHAPSQPSGQIIVDCGTNTDYGTQLVKLVLKFFIQCPVRMLFLWRGLITILQWTDSSESFIHTLEDNEFTGQLLYSTKVCSCLHVIWCVLG